MFYEDGSDVVIFWDGVPSSQRQSFISEFVQKTHYLGNVLDLRLEMLGDVDGFEFVLVTASGVSDQQGVLYAFGEFPRG